MMMMSLSVFGVCVIMSLLNLTIDQVRPQMVVAVNSAASPASTQSQASMQQQLQSNSVIQFSSTPATIASSFTKAKYKTMYACEDRQLTMDCESGSRINLIRANFGRFSITQCNEQGQLDLSTDCMSPITFRIMRERCQDRQRCSVNATSSLFGDRCPTTRKYLEVHFQCQTSEPESVDLRKPSQSLPAPSQSQIPIISNGQLVTGGSFKPPNNPISSPPPVRQSQASMISPSYQQPSTEDTQVHAQLPHSSTQVPESGFSGQATPVMNSMILNTSMAISALGGSQFDLTNKLPELDLARESIVVSMPHIAVTDMSRPRCYQWDTSSHQWTARGARILDTNQTHTICAFDQATSYVLVMDYTGPVQMISQPKQATSAPQPAGPNFSGPPPDLLESQPIPLDSNYAQPNSPSMPFSQIDDGKMVLPPQDAQQHASSKMFLYLLGVGLVAAAVLLTFVASSMRSTAGAALKSLGNFAPFSAPKYKHRRQKNGDQPSLHSNKDLLVINNASGHQFIYAPASATKISSSSSTHILSAGQPTGMNGPHQGTLHRVHQQQMYSGNGATLSSLSGTGTQSNNYYYGLTGLNPLLQQQQQQQQLQHHFSQHHLNQPQPQQAILIGHQQQMNAATSYSHQANKSTVSSESANSSSSSSGVESGSASMQQQQARTQQACIMPSLNNNDFHLMGHHLSNYGHHQAPAHNLFATLKGANVTHKQHQHQPTFTVNTVNAAYSASGAQSINTPGSSHYQAAAQLHARQASNQMHIYECVDDDKPYMARLLMPATASSQQVQQQQIFGSPTFMSGRRAGEFEARQK